MATVFSPDSREHAKHLAMIHYLADELGYPEPEVGRVYEQEFHRLSAQAKVKDFLYVLIGRRVKESLKAPQGA
jgi:outer membrane protein assembly factor BamD (BamD/ComL family)